MSRVPRLRGRAWRGLGTIAALLLPCAAQASDDHGSRYGFGLRAGGRYDNVRMCVATDAGVRGGPAADIAFLVDWPLWGTARLQLDVPVMRPVLFGAAFRMLQFEPTVALKLRRGRLVFGPSLGAILHYGPDFRSAADGAGRGPSFFALGPRFGGMVAIEWVRPGRWFDLQLGIHPYVSPLLPVDQAHDAGVVVGGNLEVDFRFR
jgi:hypothetical protein